MVSRSELFHWPLKCWFRDRNERGHDSCHMNMNFNSVILLISIFPSGSIWGKSLLMTATCFLSMLAFVFMVYRSAGWSAHSETINPVETFSLYKIKLSLFSSPFQIPFSIDNFIRNWKFFIDNDRWPKHSRLLLLAYFEPQILKFHHGSNYEKKS